MNNKILGPKDIVKYSSELAKVHTVGETKRIPSWVFKRMGTSYKRISEVYQRVNREAAGVTPLPSVAEWLVDNFYLVEEQVKGIKFNLSGKHDFRLPVLKNPETKGYPRVYALASELVAHTDGIIDEDTLINFIREYQYRNPLLMGELWALAVMLRITLVERIHHICDQLDVYYKEKYEASRIMELFNNSPDQAYVEVRNIIKRISVEPEINPCFIETLVQILRKQSGDASALIGEIDRKLLEKGLSLENQINEALEIQASREVSIGNSITSLRMISSIDWNEIFESLSHVEDILGKDPAGCYREMDFESRDYYRHTVEKISGNYNVSEISVAELALKNAQNTRCGDDEDRKHVGYYLIGAGRIELEKQIKLSPGQMSSVVRFIKSHPYIVYFSSLSVLSIIIMAYFLDYAINQGVNSSFLLLVTGIILLIPVSDISINTVNWLATRFYSPTIIPKLELRAGITKENSTMVIIPTLLTNAKRVKELLDKLEVYYLANKESNLYFALVGDFKDAGSEETGDEGQIVSTALEGISELNLRYPAEREIFYYFQRQRKYNEAQKQWIGWERKRGAIVEFNDLLRGSQDTAFNVLNIDPSRIPWVKYIITIDADTNLSMGSARKLIGAMAHPLNKPVIDANKGLVIKGHGILQPRIGVSIDSANKTLFSRIFAGQGGIDPYTTAVSDVYQDLFGEGIFTGKGIYELDTFQAVLKESLPENAVLSHDLLEGSYLRAGLVSDIELIDGYPARYNSFSMRQHRWTRGDWQLIPWLGSRIRDRSGRLRQNPLTALSKWKILDNLRRSLLNPSLLLLIILGLLVLPGNGLAWLALAAATIAFPTITYLTGGILSKKYHVLEGARGQTVITGVKSGIYQAFIQFMFIPYQAYLMTDAVVRTLARVLITRQNLLEWVPAADMETTLKNTPGNYYKRMAVSPAAGFTLALLTLMLWSPGIEVIMVAAVFGMWTFAPYAAYLISLDYMKLTHRLSEREQTELRKLTRKTWAFFEDMVTEKDNYLPPDNYQVEPPNGKAHRTSPTNIGLYMVSALAARDFGYLGTGELLERVNATLSTLEKIEKWEGHLYNWYDTINLRVLRPKFISTVDSGNLVGYLMVLDQGLKECLEKPQVDPVYACGLIDTIRVINDELKDDQLEINISLLEVYASRGEHHPDNWREILNTLKNDLCRQEITQKIKESDWGRKLLIMIESFSKEMDISADIMREQVADLTERIKIIIKNTKFSPLFNRKKQLFSIGYNVEEGSLTRSYYDLLASEARLASYIAVARGEVDKRHWFRLGRKLTKLKGYKGLVSWSGTMFEYFMPLLVMRNFENSLLDATYGLAINAQKNYASKTGAPWGISESAYYAFDIELNYQYKAFGVPELGFKRGLANELVIAPYASLITIGFKPREISENLSKMKQEGLEGNYGFYESIDYTPVRTAHRGRGMVIKNFMAHHQGMIILALSNYFNENAMQRRFHADPVIKSAEILLEERMPHKVSVTREYKEEYEPVKKRHLDEPDVIRTFGIPERELPNVQLLSNGTYSIMVTDGGSGYSKNNDIAIARWRENLRGVSLGFFIYIQNINSNNAWSATYEPYVSEPDYYRVIFTPDKAEFIRRDGNIETHTQIVVSPEDNAEVRTVVLSNTSGHSRVLEITSYLEAVLTHPEADQAHPAFSNLFVTTEYVPRYGCLLAVRRPRSAEQKPYFAVHTIAVEGETVGETQYETDRAKFIGRNRGLNNPLAMDVDNPLSNTTGAVLDPILSLRRRVRIEPGHSVKVSYTLATVDNKQDALRLADKYRDIKITERSFELAWSRSRVERDYLDIRARDMELYLKMVPSILFPGPLRLKYRDIISKNKLGQTCLWPFGISGDNPQILAVLNSKDQNDMVIRLLKGHEFWRFKGLRVDLIFLAEDEDGYNQPVRNSIMEAVLTSHARDMLNRAGGIFLLNAKSMTDEEKNLIYSTARIIIEGTAGPIEDQLIWENITVHGPELRVVSQDRETGGEAWIGSAYNLNSQDLLFYNGYGGFSQDGREYIVYLKEGQHTPAPWINVIANEKFGFNITEVGAGYTWAENSRENKLTPWYNDPVTDLPGEVFYLRDDRTGEYWSITPMPIRGGEDYVVRHGQGYTVFEHSSYGIEQSLTEFAAVDDPVKLCLIKLTNLTETRRELSLTFYIRPVLGVSEKVNSQHIFTRSYEDRDILLISNPYNCDFPGRIAFMDSSEDVRYITGDGNEFIGTKGSLQKPAAMAQERLSGSVGAGLAPCGAMQIKLILEPRESKEVTFLLGQGEEVNEILSLADKYRSTVYTHEELSRVKKFWDEKLGVIRVATPERSMDILLNSWLQYQVIACRLWSRAAFYQSGGAYGFRDQLQDVMAIVYTWPELTRKQILIHAAHQYIEGDVQHWWHPGVNKGIRTRYSDDFLWLPYVTADYIESTEDWSVLDETVSFLEDEPLPFDEDERYNIPRISGEKDTIYVHCIRAIENALKFGEHGLPLIGSGDWNDGMNKVGHRGKGESVWLGWFLYSVLQKFIPICLSRNDDERASKYNEISDNLVEHIEENAWDGSWYRRAYFDNGVPLGSAENSECRIDSIAQSWSVISGKGKPHRAREAMKAVDNYLVDREAGIIKLLTPPFGHGDLEPGYIKGYVPGVRENGGQYSHAAVWTILAFAKLGNGDKAGELFNLINPINHTRTSMDALRYKVEPYVLSADVYAVHPNTGRGGWSWYTGAAGWMYRVGLEHILGIKKAGEKLTFDPCIPKEWPEFQIHYKVGRSSYSITVLNPERVNRGVKMIRLDGTEVRDGYVTIEDNGNAHKVDVILGKAEDNRITVRNLDNSHIRGISSKSFPLPAAGSRKNSLSQ